MDIKLPDPPPTVHTLMTWLLTSGFLAFLLAIVLAGGK